MSHAPQSRPRAKRASALALARVLSRRHLAKHFEGVVVAGLADAHAAAAAGPVLLCANHSSAHDAFIAVAIDQALMTDGACLVDERSLERLPFLRAIGAVPLSLTDPRRALSQLRDAAAHLDGAGRAMWIFPQGHHVPSWRRPLGFQRGFTRVCRHAPCTPQLIPVSILPVYREALTPLLCVRLGPIVDDPDRVEAAVVAGIDALDEAVRADDLPPALIEGHGSRPGQSGWSKALARLIGDTRDR